MSKNVKVVCVVALLVLLYVVMSGKANSNSATRGTPSIIANPAVAEQGPVVL